MCILFNFRVNSVFSPSPAKALPLRCNECLKYLDDPDLKLFPGDADEAVSLLDIQR